MRVFCSAPTMPELRRTIADIAPRAAPVALQGAGNTDSRGRRRRNIFLLAPSLCGRQMALPIPSRHVAAWSFRSRSAQPLSSAGPGSQCQRDMVQDRHRPGRHRHVSRNLIGRIRSWAAHDHPANSLRPARPVRSRTSALLTAITIAMSTMPRPTASGMSPLEVSSAIAVVHRAGEGHRYCRRR